MKNNIEYSGDAWPCENQDQANYHGKDKTFTNYERRDLSKYIWPKDTGAYEYQDGNLKCGNGQKLRILTAEFGRPWNKPICWPKSYYDLEPPSAAWHEGTWLWPSCDSTDLYPYVKHDCNGKAHCRVTPAWRSEDADYKAPYTKYHGGKMETMPLHYSAGDDALNQVYLRQRGKRRTTADGLCPKVKFCHRFKKKFLFVSWWQSQCFNHMYAFKYSWIRYLCVSTDERAYPFEQIKPSSRQVLVHVPKMPNGEFVNKAMQHPTSMQKVWESGYKSMFKGNVALFKLKTDDPDNYECLGYVARELKSNGALEEDFDYKKYACVHKRYLKEGAKKRVLWKSNDENKQSKDIELMAPGRAKDDTSSLPFDYFIRGGDVPKLLDAGKDNIDETWMAPPAFDAPKPKINIYQVTGVKKVQSFKAQGSNLDAFSVWKPEPVPGLFPIGDIFVASESKPGAAILARPINENDDTFRHPLFYEPIKTLDKNYHNLFWWPVCPIKFVALGIVANAMYPSPGEFYCVNGDLADIPTGNDWENQWSRSDQFFKFGYKVNTKLWETYQKLPFFSIGQCLKSRPFGSGRGSLGAKIYPGRVDLGQKFS